MDRFVRFYFMFWSRCCCCCGVLLLLLPTTSVLKRREVPATVSSFSVSATTSAVLFASILLLLLLLRWDMHFIFLVEVVLLLLVVRELLTASVLKQREVPATVSSLHVSVLYTTMLRTSISDVVLGRFNLCPLDCDASVMVVDCDAVETRCVLDKYMKSFSPYPLLPKLFPLRLLYCCCCC